MMNLQDNLHQILVEIKLPEQIDVSSMVAFLSLHVEEIKLSSGTVEVLTIKRNDERKVVTITSIKLPNLRFKLGALLMEGLTTTLAVQSALDNKLELFLVAVNFLKKIRELVMVEVSLQEAEVLLALYTLAHQRQALTVDNIKDTLGDKLSEVYISESLDVLEELKCIRLTMDGIVLVETIIVEREDKDSNRG